MRQGSHYKPPAQPHSLDDHMLAVYDELTLITTRNHEIMAERYCAIVVSVDYADSAVSFS